MPAVSPSRYVVEAGWSDVPHLDEQTKKEIIDSTPLHMRDARVHGAPSLGAGAIFPVLLSEITVRPFQLPNYWPRCYALDADWNNTAALWAAWDRGVDVVYLYSEHYRQHAEPSIHATAIKARGDWIPGVIDPSSNGKISNRDGEQLTQNYRDLGLNLGLANNAVEAGLHAVWERLSTGRLKIFSTLQKWQAEYRIYRRDEGGKIVKKADHLMDCMRYIICPAKVQKKGEGSSRISGLQRAIVKPVKPNVFIGAASGGDRTAGY